MKMHTRQALIAFVALGIVVGSAGVVSSQDCPDLVGRWPYGPTYAVAVSGTTAYVGSGAALIVVDVSDPWRPTVLGDLHVPGVVRDIAVQGDHVYLAREAYETTLSDHGLLVVDVSDPAAPVRVGTHDTLHTAHRVAVAGDYAYVAAGHGVSESSISHIRPHRLKSVSSSKTASLEASPLPGTMPTSPTGLQVCT
jgi:hypothetical protein